MPISINFQVIVTKSSEQGVEAIRQSLGYPVKQLVPSGDLSAYSRPDGGSSICDE